MKSPIFEMSADTRLLRQRLQKVTVGNFISYADLATEISKPVSGSLPSLQSAINSLLKQDRIVFSVVRGEGLKRLTDDEIVSAADAGVDRVRRLSKKQAVKITAISDFASLSPSQQLAHTTKLSLFTAFASMATDKGIKAVSAVATGRANELPISETLKAFMGVS